MMPTFIITGSMIMVPMVGPPSVPASASRARWSAPASLNGTTTSSPAACRGMPLEKGAEAGISPSPISYIDGTTENITASWCPW
jgi:hypothetical protein